jgi:hypothetical protein
MGQFEKNGQFENFFEKFGPKNHKNLISWSHFVNYNIKRTQHRKNFAVLKF